MHVCLFCSFKVFVFSVILGVKNTAETEQELSWEEKRANVMCEPD